MAHLPQRPPRPLRSLRITGGTIQSTTGLRIVLTSTSNVSLTRIRVINSGDDGIQGTNVTGFTLACLLYSTATVTH